MKKSNLVGWKSITPIIADVLVSPWNLLVGGLLVTKLSFPYAFMAILIGYAILSLIFYFYGGLGFKHKRDTSHLLEPVFGEKGNKIFFSFILALGQIGWFAIITQIGGESFAYLTKLPSWIGIIIYAAAMAIMASLSLYKTGIVKTLITLSSFLLISYLVAIHWSDFTHANLFSFAHNKESIAWGISIIIASLVSFTSVSPDFTSQLKNRRDLIMTIIFGLFLPGVIIATLGAILFLGKSNLSLLVIIGTATIASFGHLFNVITNTDSSIAIYTPGKRLQYIFGWPFVISVTVATLVGTIFALLNITSQLEIWLSVIAAIYPGLIGVVMAHYLFGDIKTKKRKINWKSISVILLASAFVFVINISLLNWIVALTSFVLYTAMLGVTIKIYIGSRSSSHKK